MSLLVRSHSALLKTFTSALKYNSFSSMAKKSALVLLSDGSEDLEFVTSVDVLRRGGERNKTQIPILCDHMKEKEEKEIDVSVAGVQGNKILQCQNNVKIQPDISLDEASSKKFDAIVLPGGMKGSEAFCASPLVGQLLREQESSGRIIAAICAAPLALKAHGVCSTRKVTCYPSLEKDLMDGQKFTYLNDKVVTDGNLITSRGPGTAIIFALTIVDKLMGKEVASTTAKHMLLEY